MMIDRDIQARRFLQAGPQPQVEQHLANGHRFRAQGRLEQAATCFREALALMPDHFEAHYQLGYILVVLGSPGEAAEHLRQALGQRPDSALALNQLGNALADLGRLDEAIANYRRALAYAPDLADAYNNLGIALKALGRTEEAAASFARVVALHPGFAEAHNNLANALRALGHRKAAIAGYRQAIASRPDFAGAYYNLGVALQEQGRLGDSLASLREAVSLRPEYAEAHNHLGIVLTSLGNLDEAAASLRRALEINPCFAIAHSNLLSLLQYQPALTPAEIFAEHRRYASRQEDPLRPDWRTHPNEPDPERRLRVGYVSADFRHHSVAYFIEPVLARHDKARIEVFCYYNHTWHDEVTRRLAGCADHWLDCPAMTDAQLAERISADGIDILVDLAGHTAGNRLPVFARKPAPVQVTYLGYPGTSGLAAMDYRFTDAYLDPPGLTERYHSETLVRLPSLAPFQPPADCPPLNELPALSGKRFTFACLNNSAKLNPAVFALWARILKMLPESVLLLGNAGDEAVRARLTGLCAGAGIADRLILQPPLPMADFLSLHGEIDLALDPFPWNGGTTSQHALWMGVPVVSLAGDRSAARLGASTLHYAGLEEFIAASEAEYVNIALRHATDPAGLNRIRLGLRDRIMANPRTDPGHLTRSLEAAYRGVWRQWCGQRGTPRQKTGSD